MNWVPTGVFTDPTFGESPSPFWQSCLRNPSETQSVRQKERLNYSTGATNGNRIGVFFGRISGGTVKIIKSVRLANEGDEKIGSSLEFALFTQT